MKVVLLGPPGAGKGTVSEYIIEKSDLSHLSPGVLLREEISKDTTLGKDIKKYIDSGDLVPDNFVVEMVKLELHDKENVILDGFPRTVEQAEAIKDIKINVAIYLEVPEAIVVERLSGRRICSKCKSNFHVKYIPPKENGFCDHCNGELIRRKDDAPEAIKERFRVYHQKTKPLIDYYEKKGILKVVDASQEPKKVMEDALQIIENLKQ